MKGKSVLVLALVLLAVAVSAKHNTNTNTDTEVTRLRDKGFFDSLKKAVSGAVAKVSDSSIGKKFAGVAAMAKAKVASTALGRRAVGLVDQSMKLKNLYIALLKKLPWCLDGFTTVRQSVAGVPLELPQWGEAHNRGYLRAQGCVKQAFEFAKMLAAQKVDMAKLQAEDYLTAKEKVEVKKAQEAACKQLSGLTVAQKAAAPKKGGIMGKALGVVEGFKSSGVKGAGAALMSLFGKKKAPEKDAAAAPPEQADAAAAAAEKEKREDDPLSGPQAAYDACVARAAAAKTIDPGTGAAGAVAVATSPLVAASPAADKKGGDEVIGSATPPPPAAVAELPATGSPPPDAAAAAATPAD